jgi:hypothetical protein
MCWGIAEGSTEPEAKVGIHCRAPRPGFQAQAETEAVYTLAASAGCAIASARPSPGSASTTAHPAPCTVAHAATASHGDRPASWTAAASAGVAGGEKAEAMKASRAFSPPADPTAPPPHPTPPHTPPHPPPLPQLVPAVMSLEPETLIVHLRRYARTPKSFVLAFEDECLSDYKKLMAPKH